MSETLFGYSINEINTNRDFLKIVLINYSSNVKSYAKWFEISDVDINEESFTTYKVVYRLLPKELNESIKEVVVWKRFRDFKGLYETMYNYHVSLHRRDKFPDFPRPKFFNRFDDQVINERKQASLRLLQFIGSQSHLYRHEKFIEFMADGKFKDYSFKDDDVLKPMKKIEYSKPRDFIEELKNLIEKINRFLDTDSSELDLISHYLAKTRKLIELSIDNHNSDYQKSTIKFLNNSSNILSDCITETNESRTRKFLKDLNESLIEIIRGLSKLNEQEIKESKIDPTTNDSYQNSNFLNDWILSDFNLQSDDFNNELSLIVGKMFDLSFNFKFVRVLNDKCFLFKTRHNQHNVNYSGNKSNRMYVLKRLTKSYNPVITQKSIVPFGNRIPFMCQLQKYFESENTIFLLIDYLEHGRLYTHLNYLYQDPENFFKNLRNLKKLTRQESSESIRDNTIRRHNSLSNIKLNYSYTSTDKSTPKRRAMSEINDKFTLRRLDSFNNEVRMTEVKLSDIKLLNDISSSSMSSSSSLSDPEKPQVEFITNKIEDKKFNDKIKEFLKLKFDTKKSVVIYKSNDQTQPLTKSESQSSHDETTSNTLKLFHKQVKLWLAQLVISIKNLHKLGILLKDLNADNLLLNEYGMLILTYFSKWNLVDEHMSLNAIDDFYVSPELCGLVNYQVDYACDWWSFGVIAYEMLTMRKFSDMHTLNQIYVNNINFPEDFKYPKGESFIRQLLKLNPDERLKIEQIENHSFFTGLDWINLENSFWKSK